MKKKTYVKFLAALMGVLMVMSLFTGCGGGGTSSGTKDDANQTLVYNLGADPKTIDPGLNEAVDGGNVINACFEGLTRLDKDSKVKPGVAEKWDVSTDGLTYTFHLRDAKWSDGQPVKAGDFEYAWKRVADPATASTYANYVTDYIKGAEAFYNKKGSKDDVAVKAVDDKTLEVTLNQPTPYFLQLCAFHVYMPVRQDIVEKNPEGWATDPATYIGNGPFKLDKYTHQDSLELSKNENYWNAKEIKLTHMTFVMVEEPSAALTSFEKGDIEFIDNVPASDAPRLKDEGKLQISPQFGTYYVMFNNKKAPFNNPKVRKALALAIDQQVIVDNLTKCGEKPATGFVGYGSYDADGTTDFRTKGGDFITPQGNVEEAKKLLAEAGYPGGKGFPVFTYLYNTSESHKKIAEAVQDMWKKNLGINCKLANQEWAVFQNTRQAGNYDVARGGWIADFMDPVSMLDIFVTGNGNNDPKYSNTEFDKFIKASKSETDVNKRFEDLHEAEKILMNDSPVATLYFYVNKICVKPYIKGIVQTPTGSIEFDYAYVDQQAKDEFLKNNGQ